MYYYSEGILKRYSYYVGAIKGTHASFSKNIEIKVGNEYMIANKRF